MHKKIGDAIEKLTNSKEQAYFQWVGPSQKANAIRENEQRIKSIPGPPRKRPLKPLPPYPNQTPKPKNTVFQNIFKCLKNIVGKIVGKIKTIFT